MKVRELIAMLQNEDGDAEVGFAYDYGDRSHTQVVETVRDVSAEQTIYSEYHKSARLLDDDDREDGEYENAEERVVLFGRRN